MKPDPYIKILLTLFIIWLFVNTIMNYNIRNKERVTGKAYPDTYYLYFNNTIPYRINISTGEVWIPNREKRAWEKIADLESPAPE